MSTLVSVEEFTRVMREADRSFETSGGSTRHYVRECLFPLMESKGMTIIHTAERDDLLAALKDNQIVGLTEFLELVRDFTEPHRGASDMTSEQLHLRVLHTIKVVREARDATRAAIAKAEGRSP